MSRSNIYNLVLICFIIAEFLLIFVSHEMVVKGQTTNAVSLFLTSSLIGVVVLLKFYRYPDIEVSGPSRIRHWYITIPIAIAGIFLLNMETIDIIKNCTPAAISDIIPTIQTLAKRCTEGLYPYSVEAFRVFGQISPPPYLPMQWLPVCLSEYFHFDPRTITFCVWAVGAMVLMYRSMRCSEAWLKAAVPVVVMGCYWGIVKAQPAMICGTAEIMMAGYYMLLVAGLSQRNVYFTALAFTFCLLSRYFIALWLPLWVFVMFITGHRKQLFTVIGLTTVFVCILFVIPFLSRDWSLIKTMLFTYGDTGIGVWRQTYDKDYPLHLYAGTGFAHLFYEHYAAKGNMEEGYPVLKQLMFIMPIITVMLLGIWYWFKKAKINYRIFLLASFKIYLSVFLAFIIVPFTYLSISAIFVSAALFAEQARYTLKRNTTV